MARLASKERMGYYPLPERVAELIKSCLIFRGPRENFSAVDLFAGKGEAIQAITGQNAITYGNELNTKRYEVLKGHVDYALYGAAEFVQVEGAASIHYFNPPYDVNEEGRIEKTFLEATEKVLAPEGLFIGILPEVVLANFAFVEKLLKGHKGVQVRRFPDPEFQAFNQVVVFAIRREEEREYGYYSLVNGMIYDARRGFPTLKEHEFGFEILPSRIKSFEQNASSLPDAIEEAEKHGVLQGRLWNLLTVPTSESLEFTPLMKPKPGHAALMLAAGMIDGAQLDGKVIKGYHYKYIETTTKEFSDEDGNHVSEQIETERFANAIVTLDLKDGTVERIDSKENKDEYEEFVDEHLDMLLDAVNERYLPLYKGYDRQMEKELHLLHAPGTLPGHKPNGLLEPQREVVAALVTAFRSGQKGLFLEGDMGVGKTMIATSTMLMMTMHTTMKRIIVLCPPHLATKWKREVEAIGKEFGAKGFICKSILDVDEAFRYDGVSFLILGHQDAKNHAPWEPAVFRKTARVEDEETVYDDDDYYGYRPKTVKKSEIKKINTCPHCGAKVEGDVFKKKGKQSYKEQYKCSECGTPLWTMLPFVKGPRIALAYYINRKYAGYGFINDEAHETKGGDTNIGYATRWLAASSRYTIQMTGTLYNGFASGLFHMAHRGIRGFRDLYNYDGVETFVDHHGLRQRITREKTQKGWSSTYGYQRKASNRTEEIPGATPGIVALLLPYTAFLHIEDISADLPPYKESQLAIDADKESAAWKNFERFINGKLYDEAKTLAHRGNMALMSAYLQASLGYMDCPENGEKFEHKDIATIEVPPASDAPEKDDALIKLIQRENSNGNRVLIYVMQANRRDPMPRIGEKLKKLGIKYAVLRRGDDDSLLPNGTKVKVDNFSREEFVARAVSLGVTVMMCSPELVKTGLDLIQFPRIVFLAPHYSIFLLKQASRRSWRLGQTKDVEVIYAYWKGTRQQDALTHVAKKLRAASLIDGRAASGLGTLEMEKTFLHDLVARAVGADNPDLPEYEPPEMGNEVIQPERKQIKKAETVKPRKVTPAERLSFREWSKKVSTQTIVITPENAIDFYNAFMNKWKLAPAEQLSFFS